MKLFSTPILALLASFYLAGVSTQIILEVPGYGVLNGTTDTSSFTERLFYSFKSVYYAEMPTAETRFLVRQKWKIDVENLITIVNGQFI